MGSAMTGTGIDAPNSAFRFSTTKPVYLKTARHPEVQHQRQHKKHALVPLFDQQPEAPS